MSNRENIDLEKRLAYFEQKNIFMHQALDMIKLLSDFQASINQLDSPEPILKKTGKQAALLIEFKTLSFFLVDENTGDFTLTRCYPDTQTDFVQQEVDVFVEDGTFSRAIFEKKPITAYSRNQSDYFLLHVMTTVSRVRGMFVGVLKRHAKYISEDSYKLFSILMMHCSNALESYELYSKIRQSHTALAVSESNYRLLAETANEMIFRMAPDGRIEYANASAIRAGGYSTKEMLQMNVFDLIDRFDEIFTRCRKSPGKIYTSYMTDISGEPVAIELNVTPFSRSDPSTSYLLVARDISDRIRFEKETMDLKSELWQSQKMEALGALAGGIAHDFNNILSGIFGYSQLAKTHIGNPEKAVRSIEQIIAGAQKATDLVQQILAFTRKSEQENQPLKMSLIIKEALKLLRASIPSTIKIMDDIASSSKVLADPIKIHQLIMNLCTNAYHAMTDTGGTLSVTLENAEINASTDTLSGDTFSGYPALPPGSYVRLEVRDTGHGMESATLDRIFQPYFTTKEPGRGTGLGLSVVKGIVKEYKGDIRVESEPGKGTAFIIFLPAVTQEKTSQQPPPPQAQMIGGSETIMIVDDEESLLDSTKNFLEDFGYRVRIFLSAVEALDEFKKDPAGVDLVITDMTMPDLTGDQLALELLQHRPELPVFLCTGYSERVTHSIAKEMGIREYIEKPMILADLGALIRKALDSPAPGA